MDDTPARTRNTKFTPETCAIILEAIGLHGLPISTACEAAGIAPTTYQRWITRGREQKRGRYASFVADIDQALAQFQRIHADRIIAASTGVATTKTSVKEHPDGSITREVVETTSFDWRASAWLLERRFPDWNQKLKTEQNVNVTGGPVTKVIFETVPIPPEMLAIDDYAEG